MAPSLISTGTFPGDDISPEAIGAGASMLRFVGDQVAAAGADVVSSWSGIADVYDAPESGQLVAAMTPARTSGDTFDSHLGSAADALVTFADEVRAIKKTLEGIRGRANEMLAAIDSSGKVHTGAPGGTSWWQDPTFADMNAELIAAVDAQAALLKNAERTCAGAIEGVAGGGQRGENGGPGFSEVTAPATEDAPWGHLMTGREMGELWRQEAPSWEQGGSDQVADVVAGLLPLVGLEAPQFDKASGLLVGPMFTSWSGRRAATAWEGMASMIFRHPLQTLGGAVKDFTAWNDWDRPGYAAGKVVVNLALLAIPVPKLGSLTKIGAAGRETAEAAGTTGSKVASEAERAAAATRLKRLAELGQRAGARVTAPTVDGMKTLARTAQDTWTATLERLGRTNKVLAHDIDVERASSPTHAEPPLHDVPAGKDLPGHPAETPGHGSPEHPTTAHHDQPGLDEHHDHPADASSPGHHEAVGGNGSAHDLGGTGTAADPKRYSYASPAEELRDAPRPGRAELRDLKSYKTYTPGTAEHMNARWKAYQAKPGSSGLTWEAWRNRYIANQANYYKGTAFEDLVVHQKGLTPAQGWETHQRVDLAGRRDYDAYNAGLSAAQEFKAGNTVDKLQLAKDAAAVDQGLGVHYVFGREPTAGSVRLMREAGVTWEVVHSVAVPVG